MSLSEIKKENEIVLNFLRAGNLEKAFKTYENIKPNVDDEELTKEIENFKKLFFIELESLIQKYISNQNYLEAIKGLEFFTKQNIDVDKFFYKKLALLYLKIGDNQNFIKSFSKYQNFISENELTFNELSLLAGVYINLYHESHMSEYGHKILKYLKLAEKQAPQDKEVKRNISYLASELNENELALLYAKKLMEYKDVTPDDKFHYAIFNLKKKNLKEYYKYWDERFYTEAHKGDLPEFDKPMWTSNDKNLNEKTLLIMYEQGFGDTILMAGYLNRLEKLFKKVIFVVQDQLCALLKENFSGIEILPASKTNLKLLEYDCWISSMSIPVALNLPIEELSFDYQYIYPNKELSEKYKKELFNNDKLKIGLSFSGNKLIQNCHVRLKDIPVSEFIAFDNLKNVELYSLSKDISEENFSAFKNNKIHNLSNYMKDFSDTASLIENCDIIITADNVILNLAGAMNKKTIGLFNFFYSYRWYDLNEENCGWFTSVKPIVNEELNNWKPSIEKTVKDVEALIKQPKSQ